MSDPGERGSPRLQALGLAVGAAAFALLLLAPGLPLDGPQRRVAAVTALTASLWITVAIPVGATSLLPAVLFPLLGVLPAREVAPLYMRDLVLLFVGAFIVALGLERWGVHRRMALAIISVVGSSRRRLVLGFMVAAAFLSFWINNTATTLLMLPIVGAVLGRVEEEGADDRFAWCLLLGVAYSASVGGMGTPVGTAPNQEFLGQFSDRFREGPRISFGEWFLGWAPLVVVFVPLAWLLLTRVIFRIAEPGAGTGRAGMAAVRAERAAQGPMTSPQRRMAALFAATAFLWVFRVDVTVGDVTIPGWSRHLYELLHGDVARDPAWLDQHKNDVSDATVATMMGILAFVVPAGRDPEGRRRFLMDWRTAVRLPWDVLLLLGGGFCLARGFNVSGLDRVLGEGLAPLFADRSTWIVVGATALLVSFLTEVTSNTATTAVLLPVMAAAAVQAGVDPRLAMVPATLAASAAFMLPVATPPNAVVFASGRVPAPVMARGGFLLNLLAVALVTLVFQLWVRRLWGIGEGVPTWAR